MTPELLALVKHEAVQKHFADRQMISSYSKYCLSNPDGSGSCTDGDCSNCFKYGNDPDYDCRFQKDWLYIPTIEDALKILGDRFLALKYFEHWNDTKWECDISFKKEIFGATPLIALLKAVIAIESEEKIL